MYMSFEPGFILPRYSSGIEEEAGFPAGKRTGTFFSVRIRREIPSTPVNFFAALRYFAPGMIIPTDRIASS